MANTDKTKNIFIVFCILIITLLTFSPVLKCHFTDWDDDTLVLENKDIRALNLQNIKTIFTSTYVKTYIPLTIFSYALEYSLFKYNPFIYHLNNLLLHLGVVILIFVFAMKLGLKREAAGFAALIFAIHPMHIESVAWVTERKDV